MIHSLMPMVAIVAAACVQPLAAAESLSWEGESIPADIVRAHLQADRVLTELPCDWRATVSGIFRPLVAHCRTAREATLHIAANMTAATGVYYSRERRKAEMNALEALAEKKVSCSGQSILLVCALRSVGIPARAVGVMTWNHVRGNHTWVEAWVDGGWQMIEFNEKDFNTPWVMEGIGMLNPDKLSQRIYAVAASPTGRYFPPIFGAFNRIPAEDVTERYLALARDWYAGCGMPENCQRLMVDVHSRHATPQPVELLDSAGNVVASAMLPTVRDDMRRFATLMLPREGRYLLRTPGDSMELVATPQPVRIIRLQQ